MSDTPPSDEFGEPTDPESSVDLLDVDGSEPAEPTKAHKARNTVLEWALVIVVAIGAALLVKGFLLQQFQVSGHSMDTTLHDHDRVLVNKLSYRLHDPNRGDVVVLATASTAGERDLIKRVIGLPGETVDIKNCHVYIDDQELIEPYLDPTIAPCTDPQNWSFPYVVPEDHVFVLGDNRPGSKDSREIGPIAYDDLLGRAFVIIWPVSDWAWL